MAYRLIIILALLFNKNLYSQNNSISDTEKQSNSLTSEKKKLNTIPSDEKVLIDGELDESIWQKAEIATNFVMFEPDNGKPIAQNKKSDVKIVYDNEAIYIGAMLYDNEPNKIMKEITQRDNDGSSDFFGVSINGYNDGQQEFRFYVTAAGVQLDCNSNSQTGEDFSWDAIWESKTKITDKGWIVEMRIPYSALRFSKESVQTWGINFLRQIRRDRQLYTWTHIDNKKGSFEQQAGELHGIENIKTPTRLFFFPYASIYVSNDKKNGTKTELKGGLDIKYGINDAFTLDAILVPDFGQTALDNQILNLGPFEQQFNENRPFFTEGTDLFSKGDLFYSRRIGGRPSLRRGGLNQEKETNEIIEEYPSKVNLLNALKISGRTKGGLGIGFLNAITQKTEATLLDTISQTKRKVIIEPITNFSILTLDQRFNKNSSVSLVNTNVTRDGEFRDANVTALVWDLNTTKNTFNLSGDFKYSNVNEYKNLDDRKGYNTSLNFAETSGKIRFNVGAKYVSKEYDNNDLGINFITNYSSVSGNINYRMLKPSENLNAFRLNWNVYTEYENITGKLQGLNLNTNYHFTTKKNNGFGVGFNSKPINTYDFYSPGAEGRFVTIPKNYGAWVYYSSNYNKKFAVDIEPYFTEYFEGDRIEYGISFGPRYRLNNKISFILNYNFGKQNSDRGLVDYQGDNIIYAQRDVNSSTLALSTKYALNNKMTININSRYYWSYVQNDKFLSLQTNGTLIDSDYTNSLNQDFNTWNIDCSYSWWISPGSQLNMLYRNTSLNSLSEIQNIDKNVSHNFNSLFGDKLQHTFSISLRYFLDYNRAKSWI
ncbi:MAG: DUF5916 domain-containing protein [Flavobacterium sp.]|uniref:DUF5916 domain-containing protein n=1 Tax=Flavobacterium sp. TaxID=239 RepID=UPI00326771CE